MFSNASPVAAGFAILLVFLFLVLLLTWCCKQFSHSKEATVTVVPQPIPPQQRYITTIDVQTGLPVTIDISALSSSTRNQIRVLSARHSSPCPINMHGNTTLYGSIVHDPMTNCEVLPRTPPPPYSEIYMQPRT